MPIFALPSIPFLFSATEASEADVVTALENEGLALIISGFGVVAEAFAKRVVLKGLERKVVIELQDMSAWLGCQILKYGDEFVVLRTSKCKIPPNRAEKHLVSMYKLDCKMREVAALEKIRARHIRG